MVDDFTKESIVIEVDTSISGARVARVLDRIAEHRPLPIMIRVDHGPEFTSLALVIACIFAAAVCGYMAGLIGSSNSPVSGIAILTILGTALSVGVAGRTMLGPNTEKALIAFSRFVTSVVLAVAVIGNDNLQDLKTGRLVDATPWKQQVGLLIGVFAGSLVVPLVLALLNQAYGFAGAPASHAMSSQPLAAPQAILISTLATRVIDGSLPWHLLLWGAALGVGILIVRAFYRWSARNASVVRS